MYQSKNLKSKSLKLGISITLSLHRGDNVNNGPPAKHFFQRTQQHGGWTSPQSSDKLL